MFVSARIACVTLLFLPLTAAYAEGPPLAEYFRVETARIAARPLLGIDSAEGWKERRPELQRKLKAMLGLDPEPPRGDLKAEVRRVVERPDFVVEDILYQSSPGLYVTANLYRPRRVEGRLPAILYVCGHGKVEKAGVIYGCKSHYQHHAAWFAANGYVCLIVDTLQLGELPGLHHGTFREGMWWWQSRGYTPAGIEAWNAVRGIDYLVSRPEVDGAKIGVTGRSGGGATSWWVGAIDDRVAAVAPVAGITDLQNHVVDGVIEGHCDCMFFVNTERWDFPVVAALVAPKPLLVENTDHDPIFPEDGVRRIYRHLETVYGWYGAKDQLSLIVGKGGHVDTEELRHPAFAFFEKTLKGKADPKVVEPGRKLPIEELRVLKVGEVPPDSRNATIHETFVAKSSPPPVPSPKEWEALKSKWIATLKSEVVRGWPSDEEAGPLSIKPGLDLTRENVRLRTYDFTSQAGIPLRLWIYTDEDVRPINRLVLEVVDEDGWWSRGSVFSRAITDDLADPRTPGQTRSERQDGGRVVTYVDPDAGARGEEQTLDLSGAVAHAILAPRGIGPTAWPKGKDTHIRRRFALLGQTLDGMRAYDVRRALAAAREIEPLAKVESVELLARGPVVPTILLASVFEPSVTRLGLFHPPQSVEDGPSFLDLSQLLDLPQLVALAPARVVTLVVGDRTRWTWALDLAANLGAQGQRIEVRVPSTPGPASGPPGPAR